jgi:uncharacterized protein
MIHQRLLDCNEAVVKIASRCNINCTYCYMYNKGDNSYMAQPKFMHPDVYKTMYKRIKKHCQENDIDTFFITIHGGEPLLAGKKYVRDFIETGYSILNDINLVFSVQTNGILLDTAWCDLFAEFNIQVGISIDVSESSHNTFRVDHKGKGTFDETLRGLQIAQNHPRIKNICGVLSVIDVNTDPNAVYNHFASLGVSSLDLLFPDNNYDDLPTGMDINYEAERDKTPYGNWLATIFDRWITDQRIKIRLFSTIVNLVLGKKIGNDILGNTNPKLLVIETDGGIEPVDSLKICGPKFTKLGLNVTTNELKDILETQLYQKYYYGKIKLPRTCQTCVISDVCGGGFLPNRYSSLSGFDNPSVYCLDLLKLITHIQNTVVKEFTSDELDQLGMAPVTYEQALTFITKGRSEYIAS